MKKIESYNLLFIVLLLILRDFVPFFSSKVSLIASLILYLAAYFSFYNLFGSNIIKKYFFLFCVPFVDVVFSIFNSSAGTFPELTYGFIQLFVWAFVCEYIANCRNSKIMNSLFLFFSIAIILTSITTYYGCLNYPGASRALATGLKDDAELRAVYSEMNIGGFDFIYILVAFMPFLINLLRLYSKPRIRILVGLVIVIFYVTIFKSEYSTAILLSLLSLSVLFLPQKMSIQRGLFMMTILILFLFIFAGILPSLFEMLSRNTESYDVSSRMNELSDLLEGKQVYGDTYSRTSKWEKSIMNFGDSPIIGTGSIGGGHSMILDHMSKYGLFGIVMVILQFRALYNIVLKPLKDTSYYTAVLLMFFINVIMCLVNTYFSYASFIIFVPLITRFINKYNYKKV